MALRRMLKRHNPEFLTSPVIPSAPSLGLTFGLSKVARFSETSIFRGSLESGFEGALLDTLESIVFERPNPNASPLISVARVVNNASNVLM